MIDLAEWTTITGHLMCRNCLSANITFRELGGYQPGEHISVLFRCFECDTLSALSFHNDNDDNPRVTYQ